MAERARILVCGATGYLGRFVVKAAHARGHYVRALVRDAERLGDARAACDDLFVGQATDAASLDGLCDDVDVVISSLGNRTLRRRPTVWEVDYGANRNILREAERAQIKQFIFVSVLMGAETRAEVPQVEARERVVDDLKASNLTWTIVRPSGFFNDMAEFFHMARKGGAIWLVGDGHAAFNPIHGADLAEVTVDQVLRPASFGAEVNVGGPDILTLREIGFLACEAVGRKPKFRSVPIWALRSAAVALRPFNVNVASLVAMFCAMVGRDAVTDRHGDHHLADFFAELASAQGDDLRSQR